MNTNNKYLIKTNIDQFDKLLRDGLILPYAPQDDISDKKRKGLTILIKGRPGCGKTTLALQLADNIAKADKKGLYFSLDQDKNTLADKLKKMIKAQKLSNEKRIGIRDSLNKLNFELKHKKDKSSIYKYIQESTFGNLTDKYEALVELRNYVDNFEEPYSIIVIDGLNSLTDKEKTDINLQQLVEKISYNADITIVVYEPLDITNNLSMDFLVDMVINLEAYSIDSTTKYLLHFLSIEKSRFQDAAFGQHQYKIRNSGIDIYPSIHFIVHHPGYMEKEYDLSLSNNPNINNNINKSKIIRRKKDQSIIEGLLDGIEPCSTTVILGARGTYKTVLSLDYLIDGARHKESGLIVSLIDNKQTLDSQLKCYRKQCDCYDKKNKCKNCSDNLYSLHQRPGCITPEEYFYYLDRRLSETKIKRVAFWDLTQIDYRFPFFSEDKMFLPGLFELLKMEKRNGSKRELKSIIIGAGNAKYSKAASAMADNILYCWQEKNVNWSSIFNENVFGEVAEKNNLINMLMIYIDRKEGNLGNEGQALYGFAIDGESELILPCGNWDKDKYLVRDCNYEKLGTGKITEHIEKFTELQDVNDI